MVRVSLSDLKAYVDDMMRSKKILNYEIDVVENKFSGDGNIGDISFIKVNGIIEKNEKKCYDIVIKSAKKNDVLRTKTPIRLAFEREIFMYTDVFPALYQFQFERNVAKPCDNFAKCYSVCLEDKKEAMILQNLKSLGYELHDRMQAQNLDHGLAVFKNYAKLHAVSLAMKLQKPELFYNLTKTMSDVMVESMRQGDLIKTFQKHFSHAVDILKKSLGSDSDIAKKYENFNNLEVQRVLMRLKEPNSPQSVINHSDCWNNNMLFRYEGSDKTKPTDNVKFVDFQLSTVASPACDLSHYLYSCTDKAVLQHFDLLLQTYHSALTDALKELGCDSEDIFTLKDLKDHWKKFGGFGLAMSTFLVKMELSDSTEIEDFGNVTNFDFEKMFDKKINNQRLYDQRMIDVLTHFGEHFL